MDLLEVPPEGVPLLALSAPIARVTFRRPSKRNRLQPEDLDELRRHLQTVNEDLAIRVLILTGQGRAFSSGFDLTALRLGARDSPDGVHSSSEFSGVVDDLESLRVPTICRLNGGVYGGATDLALACDFRIGSTDCEMSMPAARLGLHYYASGLRRWTSRLGVDIAKRLFLLGQVIDATQMAQLGFLTEIVPREKLDDSVNRLAEMLSTRAPLAVEGMKVSINEIGRGQFDEQACDERNVASLRSADLREGLAAWQEKRPATFQRS